MKVLEAQTDKKGQATLVDVVIKLREAKQDTYKVTEASKVATLEEGSIPESEVQNVDAIYVTNPKYGYEIKVDKMLKVSITGEMQKEEGQKTYKITYNANGGEQEPEDQIKKWGEDIKLSEEKPTKAGHTFLNWNTQANGAGTSYNAGANYTENAELKLYAQWKPNGVLATTAITPSTYGESVKYSANGVEDWKIFFNDGTNIYIIAADYVPRSGMTLGTVINAGDGNYCVRGDSQSNFIKWLKDTTKWTEYANGISGVSATATGGPTLEQFWLSYNKKYNTNYSNMQDLGSHTGYSNTLYFPHREIWNSCYTYCLATPDTSNDTSVWRISYNGSVLTSDYVNPNDRHSSTSLSASWNLCK